MRTFTIRLKDELYQRLEAARGNKNKADYIREVLEENLREPQENRSGSQHEEIAYLRMENTKLLELLAREQALHLTTQQRLLPDLNTEGEIKKSGGSSGSVLYGENI